MAPPVGPPIISTALIEYLERTYRVEMPLLNETERSIFFRAGQCDVVKALRHIHDRQQTPS